VYKGELKPTRNIMHFFAYLSLFPQLVAGPIVRARDLLERLTTYHPPEESLQWEGLKMIVSGFFMKVVIADNLAPWANEAFNHPVINSSSSYWWLAVTFFAFQIYYDFAGYSLIARGLMAWIGYPITINFNHPYTSRSFKEFWTRWHISLSSWFRDYVYIPLGGSANGRGRAMIYLWITMLISGLWHGAAWNFIIWGGLHAFYLTAERLIRFPQAFRQIAPVQILSWLWVILLTWVAWVFFRASDPIKAIEILRIMFSFNHGTDFVLTFDILFFLALALLPEIWYGIKQSKPENQSSDFYSWIEMTGIAVAITATVYLIGPGSEFIYFQF
jgi:alginate O-acetyltransferase complex protein AlgI